MSSRSESKQIILCYKKLSNPTLNLKKIRSPKCNTKEKTFIFSIRNLIELITILHFQVPTKLKNTSICNAQKHWSNRSQTKQNPPKNNHKKTKNAFHLSTDLDSTNSNPCKWNKKMVITKCGLTPKSLEKKNSNETTKTHESILQMVLKNELSEWKPILTKNTNRTA